MNLVRRRVRNKVIYEAHLVAERPVWRRPGVYATAPDAVAGTDLGPSTCAVVALDAATQEPVSALLVRATADVQLQAERKASELRLRRLQRAQDRSKRATNPAAFGADRKGRPARGSYLPGHRLAKSATYKRRSRVIADLHRRMREARRMRTNLLARTIVSQMGTKIVTEDLSIRCWQRTWGPLCAVVLPR